MLQGATKIRGSCPIIVKSNHSLPPNPWLFRRIDDQYCWDEVFEWYSNLPKIFKAFTIFQRHEKDEFIEDIKKGRNYAGYLDGKLKSVIHGEIKDGITIEGHLFCEPNTPTDYICNMVTYAKVEALTEFQYVVTQVLKRHPILHTVMARTGFLDSGLRSYSKVYKKQLLEVVHYITWSPDEKQNKD